MNAQFEVGDLVERVDSGLRASIRDGVAIGTKTIVREVSPIRTMTVDGRKTQSIRVYADTYEHGEWHAGVCFRLIDRPAIDVIGTVSKQGVGDRT